VAIIALNREHWPAVREIYAAGIAGGDATFATEPPTWQDWDDTHLSRHRFVDVDDSGRVLGWVAVCPTSRRDVYAGVVEVSVYVDPDQQRRGIGGRLLRTVIASTESDGIWTLQAGIFPDNIASLQLHESVGFVVLGVHQRLGRMGHRWRDVVRLERRSAVVG
jgi:L-amino acid N-acyltransferase YncA